MYTRLGKVTCMNPTALEDPRVVPSPDELPADTDCLDRASLIKYARKGFTIDCPHTRPWGEGTQVTTPCCQASHRNVRSGDLVNCRGCGWWYRIFYDATTTRWVSCGYGKNR